MEGGLDQSRIVRVGSVKLDASKIPWLGRSISPFFCLGLGASTPLYSASSQNGLVCPLVGRAIPFGLRNGLRPSTPVGGSKHLISPLENNLGVGKSFAPVNWDSVFSISLWCSTPGQAWYSIKKVKILGSMVRLEVLRLSFRGGIYNHSSGIRMWGNSLVLPLRGVGDFPVSLRLPKHAIGTYQNVFHSIHK